MDSTNFIWNAIQQGQISRNAATAGVASGEAARAAGRSKASIEKFEERINKLVLVCKATFELLQETSGVTENQLAEKILEIDLRDGKEDGKVSPVPKRCPECDASICAKFNRCLFCGYEDTEGDAFHTV